VDEALRQQISRLERRLDGAVALMTGRTLADLDRLFDPLRLPAAGLHGAERRTREGGATRTVADAGALAAARACLEALTAAHPGLRLEDKGAALAVHFRVAPLLENLVDATCAGIEARFPQALQMQRGLLVRELKPRGADKGSALRAFMAEAPFAGRTPVALGDDITDLDAFEAAAALGGFGIAVGSRVASRWTLAGPRAVRAWLAMLAER
jgi:trehalose 6-phosphate phosphatase